MCSGHKVERSEEVTTPSGLCPARADRERDANMAQNDTSPQRAVGQEQ